MQDQAGDEGPQSEDAARRRLAVQSAVVVVVIALCVAFVLKNSQAVEVDFLVFSRHPRLIWVIVGCMSVGFGVGFWVGGPYRAFRRARQGNGAGQAATSKTRSGWRRSKAI